MTTVLEAHQGSAGAKPTGQGLSDNQIRKPDGAPIAVAPTKSLAAFGLLRCAAQSLVDLVDAMQLDEGLRQLSQARQFRGVPDAATLLKIPAETRALVAPVVDEVQALLKARNDELAVIRHRTDGWAQEAGVPAAVMRHSESARQASQFLENWVALDEMTMTVPQRAALARVVMNEVRDYNKWVLRYHEDQQQIEHVRKVLNELVMAR